MGARRNGATHVGPWRRLESNHRSAAQLYTVYDIHDFMVDEIVRRGAARHGFTWHFNRPPVVGLDYEMDSRGVALERVIPA